MKTLIGVDIGTQGTKAALFDEDGTCLGQSFVPSKLHRPDPATVEEDPQRQFDSVCTAVRRCVRQSGIDSSSVAGIGIDGQMAGVMGVGADGLHVTPYVSWLDTRCSLYVEQMNLAAGKRVLLKTGCAPSFNHGPRILWWKHERKAAYRKMAAFVQPGGYAAMRLCGLDGSQAFIDTSYLHFSGFADNRRSRWDSQLCRQFEVDESKLPRIVRSETIVGELVGSIARRCGLKAGVPVVAGCGDTAASFLACGATREGIAVDVAGTASVFAVTTADFRPDVRTKTLGCGQSTVPGLWHPYAYINGGGLNLEWFRREIANCGTVSGNRDNQDDVSLEILDKSAGLIEPDEDLPVFIPHLGGRVSPAQPNLRGAWTGLNWNHSATHLYRAVLESVALEYAIYQEVLQGLFGDLRIKELRVTGGGEKSRLWNEIKADVLQTRVRRVSRAEGAPLGAALVAGFGVGLFGSLPAVARRWVELGEVVRPKKRLAGLYAARRRRYQALLQTLARFERLFDTK